MRLRWRLAALTLAMAGALLVFHLLHRQLVSVLPGAGVTPEVIEALERSQADLKRLAQADPGRRAEYHGRFDRQQVLVNRLRIVDQNRDAIAERQQTLVLAAAGCALLVLGAVFAIGSRRDARRLARVGTALAELADGSTDVRIADRGRDHIGTIARMIERTSDLVARDRRRLASLRHLEAWQEAARRQAHELRTPLTVARLELGRLEDRLSGEDLPDEAVRSLAEIGTEVQRLEGLVHRFASFARLSVPERRVQDASELLREFVTTFAEAWPGLTLVACPAQATLYASFDRAMIRQVLVNLCENSARALGGRSGTVRLTARLLESSGSARDADADWLAIDAADDGPGIAAAVKNRMFEPYVTTARHGEGMGLGLALSRKILLDHGGDLELVDSPVGATFRLLLPLEPVCPV